MTEAERLDFIGQIALAISRHASSYGISVHSSIIAQACLESEYGTSNKAQHHNYFGLRYEDGVVTCASGQFTENEITYYEFSSMEDCVQGYFQYVDRYTDIKGVKDSRTYIDRLKNHGYSDSKTYVNDVMKIVTKYELTQYDGPIVKRNITVAIDAGHGSETIGKRHPDGYREHWSNVHMAFYLDQLLTKNGFDTVKVSWDDDNATNDEDLGLSARQEIIRNGNCDISISIHANSSGDGTTYNDMEGVETYYHSADENAGQSSRLANLVHTRLLENTTQVDRGVRRSNTSICDCTAMNTTASIMCETGYITNQRESSLLKTDEFCVECAREIAQGIFDYYNISDADNTLSLVPLNKTYINGNRTDIAEAEVIISETYTYDGTAKTPSPRVIYDGSVLDEGVEYTVSYENNINAGNASCIITGIGIYEGTNTQTFVIEPRTITNGAWVYHEDEDGCINLDELTIGIYGTNLTRDIDYTLSVTYSDYSGYKLATARATGINNYKDTLDGEFFVEKYGDRIRIDTVSFSLSSYEYDYDKLIHIPGISNNGELIEGIDYSVDYSGDFVSAGTHTVTINGIGIYYGSLEPFEVVINPKPITRTEFALSSNNMYYTGSTATPVVTCITLVRNRDYTIEYIGDTINAGTYTLRISGIGNYTGVEDYTITINPITLNQTGFSYSTRFTYTGEEIDVEVTNRNGLEVDRDYTVTYNGHRINVGEFETIVTGIGNYTGSFRFTTYITRKNITEEDFTVEPTSFVYDGTIKIPTITSDLVLDEEYTISYPADMISVGNKTITISGIGNYTSRVEVVVNITAFTIETVEFSLSKTSFEYSGTVYKPTVTSTDSELLENTDYRVNYLGDFVSVGEHIVEIVGINNYSGTKRYTVTIIVNDITDSEVTIPVSEQGYYNVNNITIRDQYGILRRNIDYSVEIVYRNDIENMLRYATVTITGVNNYNGTISNEYLVASLGYIDIGLCNIFIDDINIEYSGVPKTPSVIISYGGETLIKDEDYTLQYQDNIDAGTASIYIAGMNLYTGETIEEFTISRQNISNKTINIPGTAYRYTGEALEPEVSIDGLSSDDFDVSYENNILPGDATIYVTGKGNYTGTARTTFTIIGNYIYNCIAEYGTPSSFTEFRVDGPFNLYADKEKYDAKEPMTLDVDYSIVEENRITFTEYISVYITVKGENSFTGTREFSFKVITEDTQPGNGKSDIGEYNFGYLDIEGSETANGDYDFSCEDEGRDPNSAAIDGGDYDFNLMAEDVPDESEIEIKIVNPGDIFDLVDMRVYPSYHSLASAFKYTGRVFVYDSAIKNYRFKVCRIEEAVDSPCRIFGWLALSDILSINEIPLDTEVSVNGNIYEFPDGTGAYIEKQDVPMFIVGYATDNILNLNDYECPYLVANNEKGKGLGYASRDIIKIAEKKK